MRKSTLAAVTLCAGALFCAAPAAANPIDDAFITALDKGGITLPDRDTAIAWAHTVCSGLDDNRNSAVLAMKLMKNTDLSPRQSGYFIGASVSAYCPQYKGKTDPSVIWLLPGPPLM